MLTMKSKYKIASCLFHFFLLPGSTFMLLIVTIFAPDRQQDDHILGIELYWLGRLLIAIGVTLTVLDIFGIFVVTHDNYFCIILLAGLHVVNFFLCVTADIAGFVLRDQIEETVDRVKTPEENINSTGRLEYIQREFWCCGAVTYTEWEPYLNVPPESCCRRKNSTACETRSYRNITGIYTDSCKEVLTASLNDSLHSMRSLGICLSLIEIVAVVLTCLLAREQKMNMVVKQRNSEARIELGHVGSQNTASVGWFPHSLYKYMYIMTSEDMVYRLELSELKNTAAIAEELDPKFKFGFYVNGNSVMVVGREKKEDETVTYNILMFDIQSGKVTRSEFKLPIPYGGILKNILVKKEFNTQGQNLFNFEFEGLAELKYECINIVTA